MTLKEILDYELFQVGKYTLQVHMILSVVVVVLLSRLLLGLLSQAISRNQRIDSGAKYSIRQLVKYSLIIVVVLLCITLLGFNLSVLFVGSAALLVGIGFGLQHLFNDFVSGIIILLDNTVKVNDVIEVDGIVCRVREIKLRTTTVMTREDKNIIIPNSVITSGKVVNWTYSNVTSRFEVHVSLSYKADIIPAMKLLKETTMQHPSVAKVPEPSIRLTNFGDSAIEITVMFWCSEVFRVENIKSELRTSIFKALRANQVEFPFPQRVVHLNDLRQQGDQ